MLGGVWLSVGHKMRIVHRGDRSNSEWRIEAMIKSIENVSSKILDFVLVFAISSASSLLGTEPKSSRRQLHACKLDKISQLLV